MDKFLILITVICWGIWGILNKVAVQKLSPVYMQIVSSVVAIITIPICFLILKGAKSPEFSWQGIIWTACGSVLATIAYFTYAFSLKNGEAGTVSALSSCYPALTFIISVLFLGESITFSKVIGIFFILGGIIFLGR